ncbi:MAG TPA: hypothetical protein VNS58_14090 [Puia sp.]|nr:hypothetical protein [Puia sp.]
MKLYFFIISVFFSCPVLAQSFGLGFFGHEVVQDRRTSLDLTPDEAFCFRQNFEISFELSFLPGYTDYFGYILRLIRNDRQNIDLIYDKVPVRDGHFRMISGDKPPSISFTLDSSHLFQCWNKFRLQFDFAKDRLIFYSDKGVFIQNDIGLAKGDCFRISFGASPYQPFKTTDVPPMKIRNIRIAEGTKSQYYWPLNERTGLFALDTLHQNKAVVINPLWIKNTHYEWKMVKKMVIDGPASVAFDPKTETLFLVGTDSLTQYSIAHSSFKTTAYKSGDLSLQLGNQSVYAPFTASLYNVYLDQPLVTRFDFTSGRWDKKYEPHDINFWHLNKFCSPKDSSLYFLNGYGHLHYKNDVYQYHIPTQQLRKVPAKGDFLTPRYLAALGTNEAGDSAYILGGYGSSSGQQILNPKNLYDMMLFDVKRKTFKKLFELKAGKEEFAFANSLVINERQKEFYGLVFNNDKYNSSLQLVKGSLARPSFQLMGNKIPYQFHDIESFSDLYFSPVTNKFISVTFLEDSTNHTVASIYTLDGAPVPEETALTEAPPKSTPYYTYIALLLFLTLTGLSVRWLVRRRKANMPTAKASLPENNTAGQQVGILPGNTMLQKDSGPTSYEAPPDKDPADQSHKAAIFLFGDLQVFDKEGNDLTRPFSPLLKELFLLILLYSIKNGRGISSEKLNEILWFDKSEKSARNNRSVNIAKLKSILDKMGGCELSKDTGYWKIDIKSGLVTVDYQEYLSIVNNKKVLDKHRVTALAGITKRGGFLNNVEYPWLDPFKSEVSNHVIDTYLHFAGSVITSDDPEFIITLADYIFYFDAANEEAMQLKCKALVYLGKHSLAKQSYESFVKEYKSIYGEDFGKDFQKCIS